MEELRRLGKLFSEEYADDLNKVRETEKLTFSMDLLHMFQ